MEAKWWVDMRWGPHRAPCNRASEVSWPASTRWLNSLFSSNSHHGLFPLRSSKAFHAKLAFNAFIIYYFLIFIYSALMAINVLKPLCFCQLNSIFFFINILLQELPLFLSSHLPKGPSLTSSWVVYVDGTCPRDLSSKYLTLSEGSRLDFICIWKQITPVDSYLCGLLVNLLTHMTALAAQLQEGNTQPHPTPSAAQTATIFPSAHTC